MSGGKRGTRGGRTRVSRTRGNERGLGVVECKSGHQAAAREEPAV